MRRIALASLLLAGVALPCAAKARVPVRHARPAVRAAHHAAPDTTATATATAASRGAHEAARTLDDIHIEGEIPVPQVLFITARDQRRFMEFQNHRYLRTSSQLGAATITPGWILVTRTPVTAGKENAR